MALLRWCNHESSLYVGRDAQAMGFTALVVVAAVLLGAIIFIMVTVFRGR